MAENSIFPQKTRNHTMKTLLITLLLTACGQVQFENTPIDAETGDSGTPAIYEGGALAPFRCTRDPKGKEGMGIGSAAMQVWLDGSELFNCEVKAQLPCPAHGAEPVLYDCRTKELEQ